MDETVGTIYWY